MKKKILISILAIIIVIIVIGLLVLAYFEFMDIESKEPKQIEDTCQVEIHEFIGRKVFVIKPKDGEKNEKKILYFHGGSYVAEASSDHWKFIEKIVTDTGSTLIFPDYPLTPKYTYKDVFKMVKPLYKEILEEVAPENLILMGDSAGGGLSLALIEEISKENYAIPSKTLLISPWLDVRLTNHKIDEVAPNDKDLNKEALKIAGVAYAGGEENTGNYLVSPAEGDLSKLKNITIFTGTYDILNPDVYVLQEKAKEQGVDIEVKEYEKAGHIWIITKKGDSNIIEKGYNDLLEKIKEDN